MKLKTLYADYDVIPLKGKYSNGRPALELVETETGEPVMVATINVPEVDLKEGEVIIKNYSENEGVLDFLTENKLIGPVKYHVSTGYVICPVADLLI